MQHALGASGIWDFLLKPRKAVVNTLMGSWGRFVGALGCKQQSSNQWSRFRRNSLWFVESRGSSARAGPAGELDCKFPFRREVKDNSIGIGGERNKQKVGSGVGAALGPFLLLKWPNPAVPTLPVAGNCKIMEYPVGSC